MPASPSTARAINDRLALSLLQQEGPLTAGQLKQLTGLSRPTVADLVDRLAVAGLITVVGESGEQRRGPNARLYGIVADRAHLAALDVRTGGVGVLVSDLVGRVLAEASVPIGGDTGTGPAVEQAVAAVERTLKRAGLAAAPPREGVRARGRLHTVGIGAPGLIDPASGDLRDSGGLPAWHRSLAAALQERLPGARVTVENETNLAALAEQREGVARDRDTFVLLWLGHGVGAAVVLDGTLRRGASGGTGEIGFLPVPGTPSLPSAWDCDGGFHSLAGSAAVCSLAAEHGLPVPAAPDGPAAAEVIRAAVAATAGEEARAKGRTADRAGGRAEARADAAPSGAAPPADRFLHALADRIAIGAASVVAVLDPGCVVLGGEVGQAGGPVLAGLVEERLRRMSPLLTEVRASTLGGTAVLRGALLTARDRAQDELFAPRDRN
ncbi:ROK family transcriptional regulator [Streptomyces alanosinicus]|uniref:Transcriptional regulator n=1 Tax=Streptomyces alanosinicus TaxID=68171 RepID=A0A918YHK6_9ACTN|nr:ROK family transcriptional regulator [Streptomyces alanosinicus]GHE02427.1 transcriptional regulator [Streptomyces alanosinicus]